MKKLSRLFLRVRVSNSLAHTYIYGVDDKFKVGISGSGAIGYYRISTEENTSPVWESLAPPISPHPDCGGRQLSQAGGEGVANPRANLSTTLLIIRNKKKENRKMIRFNILYKFKTTPAEQKRTFIAV